MVSTSPHRFLARCSVVPRIATCLLVAGSVLIASGACRQAPPTDRAAKAAPVELPSADRLARVRSYIKEGWRELTRSHADLPAALEDDKVPHVEGTPRILYVSSRENPIAVATEIEKSLTPAQLEGIRIERLPGSTSDPSSAARTPWPPSPARSS